MCFGTSRTFASGSKYVGEWRNDNRNGQGTYTFADGRVDEGIWENSEFLYAKKLTPTNEEFSVNTGQDSALPSCPSSGVFHNCFGTHTYADGSKYVGEFKDGIANGQGAYTFADGRVDDGTWENGNFLSALPACPSSGVWNNCFGSWTYANGAKYVGEFKAGIYHGQGIYMSANRDEYVGEFKDGIANGLGILTYPDGRIEEGMFENGKFLYAKKATPDKEDSALAAEGAQDSAFASNDAKPFFSCKLPPLTVEIYTDKGSFYNPHKLIAYRRKGYDEITIEDARWDVGGTGSCAAHSWDFKLSGIYYSVAEIGCTSGEYMWPENANGIITINDEWFWCYK